MGNTGVSWVKTYCQEVVDKVNDVGFNTTISAKTLSYWNVTFRQQTKFPHPNPYIANEIKPKPLLFEWYPEEICEEFGGSLSVRKPVGVKPIIVFGQDETVFSQYSFNGQHWVGPGGGRSLFPKNEGMGKMVSAFISRVTSFGMELARSK